MSDEQQCEQCDGTGWKHHPWRDGYVWCDCERGQAFRRAHVSIRAAKATKWTKASRALRPNGDAA